MAASPAAAGGETCAYPNYPPPPPCGNSGLAADRWQPSAGDVMLLERVFEMEPLPCRATREQLATHFSITSRQVQVWFQNKRQRVRVRAARDGLLPPPGQPLEKRPAEPSDAVGGGGGGSGGGGEAARGSGGGEAKGQGLAASAGGGARSGGATGRPTREESASESALDGLVALFDPAARVARTTSGGREIYHLKTAASGEGGSEQGASSGSDLVKAVQARLKPAAFDQGRLQPRAGHHGPALTPKLKLQPRGRGAGKLGEGGASSLSHAEVMRRLAAMGCCEKDPLCTRGFKHGGKGGPCSRKRVRAGADAPATAAGGGAEADGGGDGDGDGEPRLLLEAWAEVLRKCEESADWMPSRVLIQRCLNADGVSAEAAKRIK